MEIDPKSLQPSSTDNSANKRKKDWQSWSPQEKILFYEIIANGGNYSSLQKLFKTMNDVCICIYIYCIYIVIENRYKKH